jgi:hypothetical protein
MPAKKRENDAERRKRLEKSGRELGTSNTIQHFEYSFSRVVMVKRAPKDAELIPRKKR